MAEESFYMDTNVFISEFRKEDVFHPEAKIISKKLLSGELRALTSILTIIEVSSVASRMFQVESEQKQVLMIKLVQRLLSLNIEFVHLSGDLPLSLAGSSKVIMVPSLFNEAALISLLSPLRTFDLMHIAAAKNARQKNPDIRALVTGDSEIVRRKLELTRIIGMPILSPKEYVQALGLY
jgi:predicted nucleic acid-binding protein